jgi:Na+/melibiose symporter-like transporter
MTFMRKFSSAVGIFIVSTLLDIAGYVKPYEAVIERSDKEVLRNSLSQYLRLEDSCSHNPSILLTVTFFAATKYPLSRYSKKISGYLEFKKES